MKVTPTKKKFGKYKPGDVFDFPDKAAKVFIKIGKLAGVVETAALTQASQTYSTRMMTAKIPSPAPQHVSGQTVKLIEDQALSDAPYGYKADGTPRKRPGRPVSAE